MPITFHSTQQVNQSVTYMHTLGAEDQAPRMEKRAKFVYRTGDGAGAEPYIMVPLLRRDPRMAPAPQCRHDL